MFLSNGHQFERIHYQELCMEEVRRPPLLSPCIPVDLVPMPSRIPIPRHRPSTCGRSSNHAGYELLNSSFVRMQIGRGRILELNRILPPCSIRPLSRIRGMRTDTAPIACLYLALRQVTVPNAPTATVRLGKSCVFIKKRFHFGLDRLRQ